MLARITYAALAVLPMLVYPVIAEDIRIPMDACNIEIAKTQSYGKSTGSQWCAMRIKDGIFVNGIKAWHTSTRHREKRALTAREPMRPGKPIILGYISGLEVSFTDGKTTMIGTQDGNYYSEAFWDPAEKGVDWMTGRDSAAASGFEYDEWLDTFEFMLTDGTHFCAGGILYDNKLGVTDCKKERPSDPRHWIGGTLLGLSGALGSNGIEAITAYYLRSDHKNVEVHDVVLSPSIEELNNRPAQDRGLTRNTLMIAHCLNQLESGNATFNLAKDTQFTRSSGSTEEYSNAWHIGNDVTFEYSFGVPTVAQSKISATQEFAWDRTETKSSTKTDSESVTVKWSANVPVPAGKAVRVAGYSVEGKMDVTWTGKMTLTLETGQTITFPTRGELKDTFYSDSYTVIDEEDPKEAMLAVLGGDGNFVDPQGGTVSPPVSKRIDRRFIS